MSDFSLNGSWMRSRDYAARSGASWKTIEKASFLNRRLPLKFGRYPGSISEKLVPVTPEAGILEAQHLYVVCPEGWIVAPDGTWLPEHSWFGTNGVGDRTTQIEPIKASDLLGSTLALSTEWNENYGHFLLDCLPKINLFQRGGGKMSEIDWFVVPQYSGKQSMMLQKLGVDPARSVVHSQRAIYRANRLIAPTFPGSRRSVPRWAVEFLRKHFLTKRHGSLEWRFLRRRARPKRRLYVPRATTRAIANENDLMRLLSRHGFEVFDPGSTRENTIDAFSSAELVIGGHGAGLADIIFCDPGTKIIEIVPSDHIYPYWYAAADSADLLYSYVIAPSEQERDPSNFGPSPYGCNVDLVEIEEALDALLSIR